MEIQFVKTSPTQNVTILALTQVPREAQPKIAARLLAYDGVGGEQVGFLEPSQTARVRLQMMGDEFCGNASMATGAYLAWRDDLPDGASAEYPLEVSGADGIVNVRITRTGNAYCGRVQMPGAKSIEPLTLNTDSGSISVDAVVLPGITHLIFEQGCGVSLEEIERRIRDWNTVVRADALGALLYDGERLEIEPVVYVPGSNTIVRERGCGSGTAAIGCRNALQTGAFCGTIRQPGGEIAVYAKRMESWFSVQIEGTVTIAASGIAYL